MFVQLCCCFGDMIRMFYIIDRHLKCIVHLKKNIRCLQSLSIIQYFENMLDILSLWHKKNISKMKHKRRTQTKNTCWKIKIPYKNEASTCVGGHAPPFAKSTLVGASLLFWYQIKLLRCLAFTNLSSQRLVMF